ncbi:CYFA0S20e02124g1_1 [Cyberlindnera fabianii]|uniref:CYFA0S20e02124g1_1 n=1 Tax=Cyberlindnera fabianii TaxID=36022 RepID=A0A061BDI9_CYBFA|nr:hypothetical protein BON22_0920 [Cyberlindnera fabianii]CDR45946.1 CYFA0S20e02124g1_1 [Cyberlindnera fabianii]
MGSSASKQRKLPGAARTAFTKPVTSNKIGLQKHNPPHQPPQSPHQYDQDPTHVNSSHKKNSHADKIGQLRVDEIPLKLDQNHPALKTLRNRSAMEKMLKEANEHQEDVKSSVHPSTFVAIVEDLNHYPPEEVRRRYNLGEGFVPLLESAGLKTAKQKVETKPENNREMKTKEAHEFDLNRMNGVAGRAGNTEFENALDELMRGQTK